MTMDEWDAKYAADLDAAYKAMFEAVSAHTEAARRKSYLEGWRSGWDQGWNAAMDTIKQHASQSMVAALAEQQQTAADNATAPTMAPEITPTASELVHQFVHECPGRRGVEIADNFAKTVFKLPERTVRTALHRLKKAGKIVIIDGRWYEPDADIPATTRDAFEPEMEED
jgi:flagellar biosynthesis/type III secretory pathway protein FliH